MFVVRKSIVILIKLKKKKKHKGSSNKNAGKKAICRIAYTIEGRLTPTQTHPDYSDKTKHTYLCCIDYANMVEPDTTNSSNSLGQIKL